MAIKLWVFACLSLSLAACTAAPESAPTGESSDEIRAPRPDEIVGSLDYGGTRSVQYTNGPTYRALRFRVNALDDVKIEAKTVDPNQSVHAEIISIDSNANGQLRAVRNAEGPSVSMTVFGGEDFLDHYLIVRERDLQPATIEVKLVGSGVSVPINDLPTYTAGAYAAPVDLVGQELDVPLRCKAPFGGDAQETSSLASLSFTANGVAFTGGDGVLTSFTSTSFQRDTFGTSTVRLVTSSNGSQPSRLRITNVGRKGVRVEFNGPTSNNQSVCVGTARRP